MVTNFCNLYLCQWRGYLVWAKNAPYSLDWDFYEGTFYRLVTTWYHRDIVSALCSCFVQLDGDPFSREKVEDLFRQAYEMYNESLLSLDAVKSPAIRDSIFDETCWPLGVCRKYNLEGFRDASLALFAYYVKDREELHQTHFPPDVTTLKKSHVSKKLFYLYKMDRRAPLVVEALEHIGYCSMVNTFVLYGTIALQRFDTGYGFRDDTRSASPVYLSDYPTVYRYDAKRPADAFVPSGSFEMRRKTKIALREEDAKRRLAVRRARDMAKEIGKKAGGLLKPLTEDESVIEVPSGQVTGTPSVPFRPIAEVTPTTRNDTVGISVDSNDATVGQSGRGGKRKEPEFDAHDGVTNRGKKNTRSCGDATMQSEHEETKSPAGKVVREDSFREEAFVFHGLSQDSFEHSTGEHDPLVREDRQVK